MKQERTLAQHSRETGLNDWRLWRDLRRLTRDGLLGLINRPQLPQPWGKTSIEALLPRHIQQHIVQLAIAHPPAPRQERLPNPDERPQHATAPQHVWWIDVRYSATIEGHWLYSILRFDGYSRALVDGRAARGYRCHPRRAALRGYLGAGPDALY